MLPLRVTARVALVVALLAGCSSGSATTAPTAARAGASNSAGSTPAGPAATAPGNPGSNQVVPPAEVDPWVRNATELSGKDGQMFAYPCPPNGSASTIWGTDTYTADSSVCTAGVHAGIITFAAGGYVVIRMEPGQDNYTGSTRNGVSSNDYGSWGGSYTVSKP